MAWIRGAHGRSGNLHSRPRLGLPFDARRITLTRAARRPGSGPEPRAVRTEPPHRTVVPRSILNPYSWASSGIAGPPSIPTRPPVAPGDRPGRSEEHTSELQSHHELV